MQRLTALMVGIFFSLLPCNGQEAGTVAAGRLVRIVLDGAHGAKDCKEEGALLFGELHLLRYPAGWRVAIICNSVRWEQIIQQRDLDHRTRAFTNLESQLTVLNGDIFHEFPSNYRRIIAHELGHVRCRCRDEKVAEKVASELERGAFELERGAREAERVAEAARKVLAAANKSPEKVEQIAKESPLPIPAKEPVARELEPIAMSELKATD